MRLCRTTNKGKTRHCEYRKSFEQGPGCVDVKFTYFGEENESRQKWSHFLVGMDWQDVEALIAKFQEMGHPKALRIKNALKVVACLKTFIENDPLLQTKLMSRAPPEIGAKRGRTRLAHSPNSE